MLGYYFLLYYFTGGYATHDHSHATEVYSETDAFRQSDEMLSDADTEVHSDVDMDTDQPTEANIDLDELQTTDATSDTGSQRTEVHSETDDTDHRLTETDLSPNINLEHNMTRTDLEHVHDPNEKALKNQLSIEILSLFWIFHQVCSVPKPQIYVRLCIRML